MLAMTTMSAWMPHELSGIVTMSRGCVPRYYLNGFPWPSGVPIWSYTPAMLEAVEIYPAPTIPGEFLMGFPCGVVAYWTRRAPDPGLDAQWWKKWLVGAGIVAQTLFIGSR